MLSSTFQRLRCSSPWAVILATLLTVGTPALGGAQESDASALQSYLSANGLLNRGLNEMAADEYRKFLKAQPKHAKAAVARYGLGVALFRCNEFSQSAAELSQLAALRDFEFGAEAGYLLGQCELSGENWDKASAAFARVVQGWPQHELADDAQAGAVESAYQSGAGERTLALVREMAERFGASPLRPRCEYFAAAAEAAQQRFAPAVERLTALLAGAPDEALVGPARLLLAQCQQNAGQLDESLKQYRLLLKHPDVRIAADARMGLGQGLLQRGEFAAAAEQLDRVLRDGADTPRAVAARLARGRAALELGDLAGAAALLRAAEQSGPELADEAAYWLAKLDLRSKKFAEAAARLNAAAAAYPKSRLAPEMQYDLGVALFQAGEFGPATAALQTFLARFEKHALFPDALHLLAASRFELKAFDDCRRDAARFAASYPDHARASGAALLAIECEFAQQQDAAAIRLAREFLQRFPGDEQASAVKYRLGMALAKAGDTREAGLLLAEVSADPRFQSAQTALGDLAFDGGDWAAAEATLVAALERDSKAADSDVTLLRLGVAQARQQKHEAALQTFARLVERFAKSATVTQALFERGQCLLALQRSAEARVALEQVLARDEASPLASLALQQLGALALGRGEHAAALQCFEQLLARKPEAELTGEALFQRGVALLGLQRYAEAEKSFARLVAEHPNQERAAEAAARGAICLARQDRFAEAAAALERVAQESAARLDPRVLAAVRYERAWCLRKLNKPAEAAALLREVATSADTSEGRHALVDLAEIHMSATEHAQAAALLRRVLAVPEASAALREAAGYRLAVCEFEQGRHAEAASAFDQFLEAFPESASAASAAFFAGDAYARTGNPRRAADRFAALLKRIKPADALFGPALLRSGEALAALQLWPRSEQAFVDYLEHFAESDQWYQAQFGVGQAREAQRRFEEAIGAYQKVVERHKGVTAARAQFQIGECLFAMNRHDEAARELLKVDILFAYPEWSAGALFEAGRCFEKLGKPVEARLQYQRVVEKYAETKWSELSRERLAAIQPDGPRGG